MPPLFLCAGLQSSGSTLVSWCFLQRGDMDGVLDARFDIVPVMPKVKNLAWCKFTIATFRFSEVMAHFQDQGWTIKPLLVVRDIRAIFNSLIKKDYGLNGTTAEDPPLRMRLRRFHEDWQMFRDNNWPILRFESLVTNSQTTLQTACKQLDLAWDHDMLTWPKDQSEIAAGNHGNETFMLNLNTRLDDSVDRTKQQVSTQNIPPADLEWMEQQFADLNKSMDYPEYLPPQAPPSPERAIPDFQFTRRYDRIVKKRPVVRFYRKLVGSPLLSEREIEIATGLPRRIG
jgi:hypothetical protein